MRAGHTVRVAAGAVLAIALMGIALVGGPAGAQVDPEDEYTGVLGATIDLGPGSCPNEGIVVQAAGFAVGSTATFTLDDSVALGTAPVAADGTATFTFDVPAGTSVGTHVLVTTGTNEFGREDRFETDLPVADCSSGGGNGGNGNGGNGNGNGGVGGSGGTSGDDTGVLGANLARTGTDLSLPVRLAVLVLATAASP